MIRRLLIANRGEIAVRIIKACREIGVESVAVFSDADKNALHVHSADRACRIGPAAPSESYLSIPALINAAQLSGADAVHPGYGFLSEQAPFARAVRDAGLAFVGPEADVIAKMGSKIESRRTMAAAGVPIVPGEMPEDQSDAGITAAVLRVGLPALIKASAGGGGKGMRSVADSSAIVERVQAARREAVAAFGDGTLYVEHLLTAPHHVEVQVFGDAAGTVLHLFERECSVQRRHQKIIEETPSPILTPALRQRICEAAVQAARAVSYTNAGTIEFLVDASATGGGAPFYFLEMNTRLQVEHPITEQVTGVDMVHAQLAVASGQPLPWSQASLLQRGHSIEARVYAEAPEHGFLPQAGPLLLYREPRMPGVRVDSGFVEHDAITVHYDPLIAKVIASAESRTIAIERLVQALKAFPILGVQTNIPFLLRVIEHPNFRDGSIHTAFLDGEGAPLAVHAPDEPPAFVRAAAAAEAGAATGGGSTSRVTHDPWQTLSRWRG